MYPKEKPLALIYAMLYYIAEYYATLLTGRTDRK